jgi:hypothetical protein
VSTRRRLERRATGTAHTLVRRDTTSGSPRRSSWTLQDTERVIGARIIASVLKAQSLLSFGRGLLQQFQVNRLRDSNTPSSHDRISDDQPVVLDSAPSPRGQGDFASVELTRKYAEAIDGIDLSQCKVGDLLRLHPDAARVLIAEGWASPVEPSRDVRAGVLEDERAEAADESDRRRNKRQR